MTVRYRKGPLSQRAAIAKVRHRKSRYCHVMYKLLYPIALWSGQRLLCRLGSGLGLVLVLVLRFCMCPRRDQFDRRIMSLVGDIVFEIMFKQI